MCVLWVANKILGPERGQLIGLKFITLACLALSHLDVAERHNNAYNNNNGLEEHNNSLLAHSRGRKRMFSRATSSLSRSSVDGAARGGLPSPPSTPPGGSDNGAQEARAVGRFVLVAFGKL